jgi:hypothetical protein
MKKTIIYFLIFSNGNDETFAEYLQVAIHIVNSDNKSEDWYDYLPWDIYDMIFP